MIFLFLSGARLNNWRILAFIYFPLAYNYYYSVDIFRRVYDTHSSTKTWNESCRQQGKIRNVESRDINLLKLSKEEKNRSSPKKCQTALKKTATYIIVTRNIRTNKVKLKARLNILSLARSWTLWCCLCRTHVIFNRVEAPLKRKYIKGQFSFFIGAAIKMLYF